MNNMIRYLRSSHFELNNLDDGRPVIKPRSPIERDARAESRFDNVSHVLPEGINYLFYVGRHISLTSVFTLIHLFFFMCYELLKSSNISW